jgi:hypothetical protein
MGKQKEKKKKMPSSGAFQDRGREKEAVDSGW